MHVPTIKTDSPITSKQSELPRPIPWNQTSDDH